MVYPFLYALQGKAGANWKPPWHDLQRPDDQMCSALVVAPSNKFKAESVPSAPHLPSRHNSPQPNHSAMSTAQHACHAP